MDDDEYRIAKLDLKAGDILVVKLRNEAPTYVIASIQDHFAQLTGSNKIVVITPEIDLSVIQTDQAEKVGVRQMANVFEGTPDARQSDDTTLKVSRFRPVYRALTDDEKALHDQIKDGAAKLEALFDQTKPSRYQSLAMTALEEAVMWAVKGLTS